MDDPILNELEEDHLLGDPELEGKQKRTRCILLVVLAILVGFVVVDTIANLCTEVESEKHRMQRIYCENDTNPFPEPVEQDVMNCSWSMDSEWVLSDSKETCEKPSACVALGISKFLYWLRHHPLTGTFGTAVLYMALTLLFVPGSLLAIGAGAAFAGGLGLFWGTVVATISVWLGAMMGAILAFGAGRYLFRDSVEKLSHRMVWLRAIDHAMHSHGLKLMVLLRLSPIIPFNLFNYIMGCTSIPVRQFLCGSAVGIIPGAAGYVLIGGAVSSAISGGSRMHMRNMYECAIPEDMDGSGDEIQIILAVVGSIATVVAVALVAWVSRRELRKLLEESEDDEFEASNQSMSLNVSTRDSDSSDSGASYDPDEQLVRLPMSVDVRPEQGKLLRGHVDNATKNIVMESSPSVSSRFPELANLEL